MQSTLMKSAWARLPGHGMLVRHTAEWMAASQQDEFFQFAVLKAQRLQRLRGHFAHQPVRRIVLGPRLANLGFEASPLPVEVLPQGFLQQPDDAVQSGRQALVEDAVVILNNNDVGQGATAAMFADLSARCERTVFCAWDWDNHHWMENSTLLAAHVDVYAPAHHENLYPLTRYNACTIGPLYCGTEQWSRRFLSDHLVEILHAQRSDVPLGMHMPYGQFSYRSRVISTVHRQFPSVGFSERTFHLREPIDRLREWAAHKSHWIAPVLNDVPIRLFDALITGGIPIVPESMRHLPPVSAIPHAHIVFHGPLDVIDPSAVAARAAALFDAAGSAGVIERHRLAWEHHHGEQRLVQILHTVQDQLGLDGLVRPVAPARAPY